MSDYQVIARKYRPQFFREVLGQDAIVTTLKNAIKRNKLAHAYLWCGGRGTGKTTLARVLAKALNCQRPSADCEPCNECSSCREITSGNSLDVLEIDGASHRGIDDVRQINETVGYATSAGKFKIYIIDEVHMLTKEAFNALLKTLEEPPPKVKFFFATTEPQKVPSTILSRCQRFNLNRIPIANIANKLRQISQDLNVFVHEDALLLLANRADGGLRDAESLFDQILAFHDGEITIDVVSTMLGMMPQDCFFELDNAGKEANLAIAFEIAERVFSQGKDIGYFLENLTDHFRNLLLVKLAGKTALFLSIPETLRDKYEASAKIYSQEQCLNILDFLVEAQREQSDRIGLEAVLLRILRSHQRIPIDFLIRRLVELEKKFEQNPNNPTPPSEEPSTSQELVAPQSPLPKTTVLPTQVRENPSLKSSEGITKISSISEDPTPTKADLGIKEKKNSQNILEPTLPTTTSAPIELGARLTEEAKAETIKLQSRYETLLQFATVELEGTIQKKQYR